MTSLNDFELLEKSGKDERYFSELYKKYNQWLYSLFFQRTGDREASCSLCNDIWLKIWNDREVLLENQHKNYSLRGFLYVKATSRLIDYMRSRQAMDVELSLDDENELLQVEKLLAESTDVTENEVETENIREYLQKVLADIDKNQEDWLLFWKVRMEGYSIQEMAKAASIPQGTLRSKLSRMASKLRSLRPHIDLFLLGLGFIPFSF